MRWFFLLLPWIELFTLIKLGGRIGAVSTLLYVFLTFLLGLSILKLQGQGIVKKLQASQGAQMVSPQLLRGELALGLAGLLLMIPGVVTDALALPVVFMGLLNRSRSADATAFSAANQGSRVHIRPDDSIDGEFRRLDDD
ncbi:MAG: FxsA family protein [Congregibacter sp.]